jgi:hypothetical protein
VALAYNPTIVSNGLVVAYDPANPKCYPGSGVTFYDLSGNGNHGTLTNGPTISNNLAKYTVFDGSNDYIVSSNNTGIAVSSPRTIMAWAWMGNVSSSVIARIGASASIQAYEMQVWSSKLIMHRYSGSPAHVESTSTVKLNRWYHFAISYDGSNVKFYIDGAYDGVSSLSLNTANAPLYVGYPVYTEGNGHMNGNVSQVLLYNRELSASEINQNYNATKGRYAYTADIVTSGLVSAFDAGSALSYPGSGSRIYNVTSAAGATADLRDGPTIVGSGSTAYANIGGTTANVIAFSSNTIRSFSFVTWVSSALGGANYLVDLRNGISAYIYYAGAAGFSKLYVNGVKKDPNSQSTNTSVYPRNQWLHVYCELTTSGTTEMSFGNRVSYNEPFTGRLAAIQFYNRPLEQFEIQQNYDAMRGRYS